MLSTSDNPFNPFADFISWFLFDCEKGYNSCATLARIASVDEAMSQEEIEAEIERAIDEIIELDPLKIYVKVSAPSAG